MTALEKLKIEHPELSALEVCPHHDGINYLPPPKSCTDISCRECWNRKIPDKNFTPEGHIPNAQRESVGLKPIIKDSGTRREFGTGAVRDIQEGKGRCDLLPLDVLAEFHDDKVLAHIAEFQRSNMTVSLRNALCTAVFDKHMFNDWSTTFLEVAKHFEEGAKKYGEYNWQKGIPTHCYIDSAVRHYLKYLRGDKDEPHDRAFVWNILCCIWTCKHKPELNDYADKKVIVKKTETGPKENVVSDQPVQEAN